MCSDAKGILLQPLGPTGLWYAACPNCRAPLAFEPDMVKVWEPDRQAFVEPRRDVGTVVVRCSGSCGLRYRFGNATWITVVVDLRDASAAESEAHHDSPVHHN